MNRTLLSALAALGFTLIPACTDPEDGDAADDAAVVDVQAAGDQFSPARVRIKVGQTVRWTWTDGPHNVVSGVDCDSEDGHFKSGEPIGSGSFEKRFESPGRFPYYCQPHCAMGMTGEVIVEP